MTSPTEPGLPQRVSPLLERLIAAEPANGPLHLQFIPSPAETQVSPAESTDPLCEERFSPVPRLVHRYPNRVLVLATDRCAVHCRHCFRRSFTGAGTGDLTKDQLEAIAAYVGRQPAITEVLISGGDAFMVNPHRLIRIIDRLREARGSILVRLATRVPVAMPELITEEVVQELSVRAPVFVICQINHASELSGEADAALGRLVDRGVPVLSQTVLLAGVNDQVTALAALFTAMLRRRVKPYYLFQPDLAAGTRHFRVNLVRAIDLVGELRSRVSGLAMPTFAVDAPGGGGKVVLELCAFEGEDTHGYRLRGVDGRIYHYPVEEQRHPGVVGGVSALGYPDPVCRTPIPTFGGVRSAPANS